MSAADSEARLDSWLNRFFRLTSLRLGFSSMSGGVVKSFLFRMMPECWWFLWSICMLLWFASSPNRKFWENWPDDCGSEPFE